MGTNYYNVTVKTGNRGSAGTDANVYITIWGNTSELIKQKLDKPGYNDFERNDCDSYLLSTTEGVLGNILGIKLEHDNTGVGPGWYVDWVKIEDFGTNTYGPAISEKIYKVDRWLAKDEADQKTSVEYGSRPKLSITQADQYKAFEVGIKDVFIVAAPEEYTWHQNISRKNVMTITETTNQSTKHSFSVSSNYSTETNVSLPIDIVKVGLKNNFSITSTYASEIAKSLETSYQGTKEITVNSEETRVFTPKNKQRLGIIIKQMISRADGSLTFGSRTFTFAHDSIEYERVEVVPLDNQSDYEEFKARYSEWFTSLDSKDKVSAT